MTYNTPDPTWAYFTIFETLQQSEAELKQLIAYISKQEEASPQADAWVKSALANIMRDLEETLTLFNS